MEQNIPIPPGIYKEVCHIIKEKIETGVFKLSNLSYRTQWYSMVKKDGKNLRPVLCLKALNAVTICHSGVTPFTDQIAEHFTVQACGSMLDLYVGYNECALATSPRDLTTFQTPYGTM